MLWESSTSAIGTIFTFFDESRTKKSLLQWIFSKKKHKKSMLVALNMHHKQQVPVLEGSKMDGNYLAKYDDKL